jgi:hypothetical protein
MLFKSNVISLNLSHTLSELRLRLPRLLLHFLDAVRLQLILQ